MALPHEHMTLNEIVKSKLSMNRNIRKACGTSPPRIHEAYGTVVNRGMGYENTRARRRTVDVPNVVVLGYHATKLPNMPVALQSQAAETIGMNGAERRARGDAASRAAPRV